MTDRYVDSATGNNADNGTTPALAWATIEYALESGSLGSGYNVWVRRGHSEIPTSDIASVYDGAANSPIQIIGFPRTTVTGTATFTNGSTSVTVVSIAAARTSHQGRRIKCDADGNWYLITRVVDANTVTIDREYAGTTAETSAFTIQADDDYSARPQAGIDAGWDADAHTLALIDFNDGAVQLNLYGDKYHIFKNLEVKDSSDTAGIIYSRQGYQTMWIGCLIKQSASNTRLIGGFMQEFAYMERVIIEGSGAGSSQQGFMGVDHAHFKDCAIYNLGDAGFYACGQIRLENVNIGIEQANGDDEIIFYGIGTIRGRDVKLGGTNGYVIRTHPHKDQLISIENYQKILGAHKTFYVGGSFEKAAVSGETPNKKLSDNILKITPNITGYEYIPDWATEVFCHEFEVDTTTRTWKYWIFNDAMGTINDTTAKDNLWLKLEYIASYDDTSEYVIEEKYSTEIDILNAADANDWDYLQISGVTPATASKVRIKCFVADYSATGHIYIDPKVVNP